MGLILSRKPSPMVALMSGRLTGKAMARHELVGMGIILAGVALLLASHV